MHEFNITPIPPVIPQQDEPAEKTERQEKECPQNEPTQPFPRESKKRPHLEREELLQAFMLGAAAGSVKMLEKLEAPSFSLPWSAAVTAMVDARRDGDSEEAKKAAVARLDDWMYRNLGIERKGDRVVDAALERLRRDSEFRKAAKEDGFAARLARLAVAMQDKRGKT